MWQNQCIDIVYLEFLQHLYFMVKYGTKIFVVEILQMKVIQTLSHFHTLPHGYIRRIYITILSKIDRALYITVEAILESR